MLTDSQIKTIKVASSSEPTPELSSFWEQKYRELYIQKTFFLDQATEELISKGALIKEFRPPRGYINLPKHIDQGKLDEDKLHKTVEIAIRYLDDLINKQEFRDGAHKIAINYRAIKVSIQGLEIYLDQVQPLSINEEISKLAQAISYYAYRASESLAEEKGACGAWNKYKKPLTIKPFDLLYNPETDEEVIFSEFSDKHIELDQSDWEIYQRRNLTILDFPKNSSWSSWDDYTEKKVDNTPKKPRTPTKPVEVNVSKDSLQSVSEVIQSSPYKKLFSSLLQQPSSAPEKKDVKEPVQVANSPKPTTHKELVTEVASSAVPPLRTLLHIVVLMGKQRTLAGLITIHDNNIEESIAKFCKDFSKVIPLHVSNSEGVIEVVYKTSNENVLDPSTIKFVPSESISFNGKVLSALLDTHNDYLQSQHQLALQPKPEPVIGHATKTHTKSFFPQHSHIEHFNMSTSYFGRVVCTSEYLNGQLVSVSGELERHSELSHLVFGFINDALLLKQNEGLTLNMLLENLHQKKSKVQSSEMLKPLVLATHILSISGAKQIGGNDV